MEKKEEIENLVDTAIQKLLEIKKQGYSKDTVDDISFIFNVFVKNYYDIPIEFTREELIEMLKKKDFDPSEKNLLLVFATQLEYQKYMLKEPEKAKVEKVMDSILKFLKLKKHEVNDGKEDQGDR